MNAPDPQRWAALRPLLLRGLELPAAERTAWARQACGADAALRDELLALLAAHDRPDTILQDATAVGAGTGAPTAPGLPERLGRYRIRSLLGRGGMGVVYEAEQDQPRRTVALKVVRGDYVSPELLRRFEYEAQVLARLQHPGIAQVFEAGTITDEAGAVRPFFAMELVRGVPLVEYARSQGLTLAARLELLARIADAVEHAHQKGVIHRDLKPANILVDDAGQPRILDFGIARVAGSEQQQTTMHTEVGRLLGTLEYMSPEQVAGRVDDLDTRSDVYALGVIAYELLAERLPYTLDRGSFSELLRTIQEVEPTRLSRIDRTLAGDVETIVGKALAKDRERRYPSADALAADIRRYLRHEPIAARPATTWYQVARFARRHRGLVAGLVLAFVLLVLGLIGTTLGLRQAQTSEQSAQGARREAQQNLERYELLADMVTLPGLERETEDLWPEAPELAPAMTDWLQRARALASHRPRVTQALEQVRARRQPLTPAELDLARRQHEQARTRAQVEATLAQRRQDLARLRAKTERSDAERQRGADLTRREIPALEEQLAALTAAIESAVDARFASTADQFLHDTLLRLAEGLERLERETIPRVADRLEWARSVRARTVEEPHAAWQQAVATIADPAVCPRYHGLRITPQLGLLPLGQNPASGLWEFWCVRTGSRPERDADGHWRIGDDTGVVLVLLPGGTFQMGAQAGDPSQPNHDPAAQITEQPVTAVTLAPFFLAAHELTVGQWTRWTHTNPCADKPGSPRNGESTLQHPVSQVSWLECDRVLRQMGLLLPTEAQWEYACRAGTDTVWSTGNDVAALAAAANLADEASRGSYGANWACEVGLDDGFDADAPVGSLAPNGFGLHDLHGNVWEWCRDEFCHYSVPPRPGDGERSGDGDRERVFRGGSFSVIAVYVRSAYRLRNKPGHINRNLGARAARPLLP